MSLKFILLLFATILLVQNSFGRAVPEESSENELAPSESKEKDCSSSEEQESKYYMQVLLKERKFALKTIHDIFEGIEDITEGEDVVLQLIDIVMNKTEPNVIEFYKSVTREEKEYFFKFLGSCGDAQMKKELYTLLHNLYQSPSDSAEDSDNEVLTTKDKKRIFLTQQMVNYAYLTHSLYKGYIDEEEYIAQLINFYKETAKEYYDSFTKEEQEKKTPYLDLVEKLTVESAFEESNNEEDAKEMELFSQFFELTDIEKFKMSILLIAEKNAETGDSKTFISDLKEEFEKYSNSLPNEKGKLKKSFSDHLAKLNNIDDIEEQLIYVFTWMLTLKDDQEEKQKDS